jgi:hypothetical protein
MRLLRHLVLLVLVFPTLAFADSISRPPTGWFFGNSGGTMTFDPTAMTLSFTSTITTIKGVINGQEVVETGVNFGTITGTTGPLLSGTIFHSAIFGDGTMTLETNGTAANFSGFTLSSTLNFPLKWWKDKSGTFHLGGLGNEILDFRQAVVVSGTNQYTVVEGATVVPESDTLMLFVSGLGPLATGTILRRISAKRRATQQPLG